MTQYMVLYSGGQLPDDMSAANRNEVMAAWGAWYGRLGQAISDDGSPFSYARGVASDGSVTDDVAVPGVTGYTVITADSFDAALALMEGHPHLAAGGQITVYETFSMM